MLKKKLFCFPYAGGFSTFYANWRRYLDSSIDLIAIEIPGRGTRFHEHPKLTINEIIESIYEQMMWELRDKPQYAFFGHSMGCLIAYELSYIISENLGMNPLHLFFSGGNVPNSNICSGHVYTLPDEEFMRVLISYGGLKEEIIEDKDLVKHFLPIIRADMTAVGTYLYKEKKEKLSCDISVLYGDKDELINENIKEWKNHSEKNCDFYVFKGNHFYINNNLEKVIDIINTKIISANG